MRPSSLGINLCRQSTFFPICCPLNNTHLPIYQYTTVNHIPYYGNHHLSFYRPIVHQFLLTNVFCNSNLPSKLIRRTYGTIAKSVCSEIVYIYKRFSNNMMSSYWSRNPIVIAMNFSVYYCNPISASNLT